MSRLPSSQQSNHPILKKKNRFNVVSRLAGETGRPIFKKLFEEHGRDWKFRGKA